jgi:hypothetical protein
MNPDKNIFRLEHVVESIEKIEFIIKDLSYDQYLEKLRFLPLSTTSNKY